MWMAINSWAYIRKIVTNSVGKELNASFMFVSLKANERK
jgi:hypothetical protein